MSDEFVLGRLLGDTAGKRVLELGCGDGRRAVALARSGSTVITVDPDAKAILDTRLRAENAEVRVEVHTGDLADLAFLRGDSVDVAFAEGTLATVPDLGRLFRQVQRVLRAGSWFAFTLPHPMGQCVAVDPEPSGALPLASPRLDRSYFDEDPGTAGERIHRVAEVFASLGRVGFRVDTVLEPEPPATARGRALTPEVIIWRARKVGS